MMEELPNKFTTRGREFKQLPLRGRRYNMPPEDKPDTIGIDLENITGQIKHNLWDIFRESMTSYLSEGKYSEDKFKDIIRNKSLRFPIDLPGDYGVDIDINRPAPFGSRWSGITFKKEF